MTILETFIKLRDDLKLWVTNNLNMKADISYVDEMVFITVMDIDVICGAISASTSISLTDASSNESYELYVNNGMLAMSSSESADGGSGQTSPSYVVLADITTNENYKLYINNGELKTEPCDELSDTALDCVFLIDSNNNENYKLYIDSGKLIMEISEV